MSWILAFLGFALLIIFHELGHFAAAKAVGMRVEKFFLFFGKPLWSVTRGETTYGVAVIPLGGYVKITGMNPDEARELPPELYARSYAGSKVWKRIFVILAGPLVNVVIAFVLLFGIFGIQGMAAPGIGVGSVETKGAAGGKLKPDDGILSVSAAGASGAARTTVPGDQAGLSVEEIDRRIKAMTALIGSGACGGKPLGTKDARGSAQFAKCAAAKPVEVTVLRDGERQVVEITPTYDEALKRYRLGLGFTLDYGDRYEEVGLGTAASESLDRMWFVTSESVKSLVKIVYDAQARKEVSSVVGGYETTRQTFELDTVQAIGVLAVISLSLAIINMFPFLPLDGGHIFWSIVEKLRGGKPVSTAVLERASIVGFVLVILLFSIGLSNDIGRISSGEGFG
ncbi:MAG: site-2 protease family protein, partial [Solirubrobacteraceae bacterium]|nr:site-2 protease family protein [Solirubrobacteraceae bacterium]